jgi:hypothetical protein
MGWFPSWFPNPFANGTITVKNSTEIWIRYDFTRALPVDSGYLKPGNSTTVTMSDIAVTLSVSPWKGDNVNAVSEQLFYFFIFSFQAILIGAIVSPCSGWISSAKLLCRRDERKSRRRVLVPPIIYNAVRPPFLSYILRCAPLILRKSPSTMIDSID